MDVRVWVGCLAHYNNGDLVGEWVDAAEAGAWTCPKKNPDDVYINCEETWVMDHEIPGVSGEMDPMTAVKWAEVFAQVEDHQADGFAAWLKWTEHENPADDSYSTFEDQYRGAWDSEREYAMEFGTETLIDPFVHSAKSVGGRYGQAPGIDDAADEIIRYFDWDSYTRDLFQQGFHYESGHVFTD